MPADEILAIAEMTNRVEWLPRAALGELQLQRLRETVTQALRTQPARAEQLISTGVTAGADLTSLGDLQRLPFTTKADLRSHYPFGLLAVPREKLVRVQASSGTHGKPTVVGYTAADLESWTQLMARCMSMAGVRAGMVVHNANNYGLFTGGLGFHQGAHRLGATVVPVSGGFTTRQAILLSDLGAQVLVSTPSYALAIAQALANQGIDAEQLQLELGLFGAEPWSEWMRDEIERRLGLTAMNFYGLSELGGPGVAAECSEARDGLHVQEDHFLLEVIDPADGQPVPPGEEGELVFTTLKREALPLIRYRTGDIGRVTYGQCACGRTTVRLHGLRGRLDDTVIVRGVNLHPSQLEHALRETEGATPHFRLIVERPGVLDEATLECESGNTGVARERFRGRLERTLSEHTGIRINVAVHDEGSIPRGDGKAARVLDRRSL